MRGTLATLIFGAILSASTLAKAEDQCPEGWFCEPETQSDDDSAGTDDSDRDNEAPAEEPKARAPEPPPEPETRQPRGYERRTHIIIVDRPENAPRPRRRRRVHEWGLNARVEGVLMNGERASNAGMGGFGLSLRYRPIPYFAFDVGGDFLGGNDWAGNERHETALLLSGIVFFNPHDVVQVYGIGGFGFSEARVTHDSQVRGADGSFSDGSPVEDKYDYFGAHAGLGLEFRVSRRVALNVDMIGFIRGRTDRQAERQPEFVDPNTGRVTNTSGGGLARGGLTLYW